MTMVIRFCRTQPKSGWRQPRLRSLVCFLGFLAVSATLLDRSAAQQPEAAPPANPTPQERVAMMKQWLQASQAQMRAYQWIETTVVSKGGEEKARSQNTCYYGADGNLQKVPVAAGAAAADSGRQRRLGARLKESAKEDAKDYMQRAAQLVHSYIPPDPARIQQSMNGGKFALSVVQPGRLVRLNFSDYLKAGDRLSIDVEIPTNRLTGMAVLSYLDKPSDAVKLEVAMGVLPDGTIYAAKTALNAEAKGLIVTVENSGYRRQ